MNREGSVRLGSIQSGVNSILTSAASLERRSDPETGEFLGATTGIRVCKSVDKTPTVGNGQYQRNTQGFTELKSMAREPIRGDVGDNLDLIAKRGDDSALWEDDWPRLGSIQAKTWCKQQMNSGSSTFSSPNQTGYKPTTAGGKQRAKMQLAEEIRQQLFVSEEDKVLEDLGEAYKQLESSLGKMLMLQRGPEMDDLNLTPGMEQEVAGSTDIRFDHSWLPDGPYYGLGWYWIPKGSLTLSSRYRARPGEIKRFQHLARGVRRLPPPEPLSHSFARAVVKNMANRGPIRPMKRRQEDWRQKDWMEEDDLLEDDFKQEQDLRSQLLRDTRNPGEGYRGRRMEGSGNRTVGFGERVQERNIAGKGGMGARLEGNQGHQGGWNQNLGGGFQGRQGAHIPERRLGQETRKEEGRERGIVISDGKGKAVEGNRANPNQDMRCFRCLGFGHHQVDCTEEPVCYKCKEKGHMAVECKITEARKLKMFGFGIPGQGFYALNFPEAKVKTHQATGMLTILDGEATEGKIDRELKNLVRENWDFKVKQIHFQEFLVVFPDKNTLHTFTKFAEFQMPIYGLKGRIEKTERDAETSSLLQTVWIKVHNIPDLARETEAVKEIVALVAEPLVVDELSLIRSEPVRVQSRCRNPSAIKGSIEIFFNGVGKFVRFEVEGSNQGSFKGGKGGPSSSGKPDDQHDKDNDKQQQEDKARKSLGKFDRIGKIDKEVDSSHEESMEEDVEVCQDGQKGLSLDLPVAVFHPTMGLVEVNQNGDQLDLDKGSEPQNPLPESHLLIHDRDGTYLMEKTKWPILTLPEEKEPVESLTQEDTCLGEKQGFNTLVAQHSWAKGLNEMNGQGDMWDVTGEDIMDSISNDGKNSDKEEEGRGWQSSNPRKMKKKSFKQVVVATRTSKRLLSEGIPITGKATSRDMGNISTAGTLTSNPFTVLCNTSDDLLQNTLNDLNLVVDNVGEQLGVFRAEERARAALAEANYKVFLDRQKDRDKPRGDDIDSDLSMGIIDNGVRLGPVASTYDEMSAENRKNTEESSVIQIAKGGYTDDMEAFPR